MFMMRNFFYAIPDSLIESAELDGANQWQILTRIVLPCSLASIATILLFYAVGHWNSWFDALLYISDNKLLPMQNLLRNIIAASNMTGAITDWQTIAQEARKINPDIYLVTDAVQHAPHGQIDFDGLGLDGVNIAPYKFLGNRGISFGFVSDRARALDHPRIIEDEPDIWELGSIVPAHYAAHPR